MPADNPYVKRSVQLLKTQDEALRAASAKHGNASLNSLIRQAIDQWLKDNP